MEESALAGKSDAAIGTEIALLKRRIVFTLVCREWQQQSLVLREFSSFSVSLPLLQDEQGLI